MNNTVKAKIRAAVQKDIPEICYVNKTSWLKTYSNEELGITQQDLLDVDYNSDKKVNFWKRIIDSDSWRVWVATVGNKIIAVCTSEKGIDENYFSSIYILPEYQNQGIGKEMAKRVFEWLGDKKPISLTCAKYNQTALSFYGKLGFDNQIDIEDHILPNGKKFPVVKLTRLPKA